MPHSNPSFGLSGDFDFDFDFDFVCHHERACARGICSLVGTDALARVPVCVSTNSRGPGLVYGGPIKPSFGLSGDSLTLTSFVITSALAHEGSAVWWARRPLPTFLIM